MLSTSSYCMCCASCLCGKLCINKACNICSVARTPHCLETRQHIYDHYSFRAPQSHSRGHSFSNKPRTSMLSEKSALRPAGKLSITTYHLINDHSMHMVHTTRCAWLTTTSTTNEQLSTATHLVRCKVRHHHDYKPVELKGPWQ